MIPENVSENEIIGLRARIVESRDPTLKGLSGTVVFETKNIISIRTEYSVKQVPKSVASQIELKTDLGLCLIVGPSLIGRPEDRISRWTMGVS